MYRNIFSDVADMHLNNGQYGVFLKLLSRLDADNYRAVSQKKMAEELGTKQSYVSRAIKGLLKKEILFEGSRLGLNKTYRVNLLIAVS